MGGRRKRGRSRKENDMVFKEAPQKLKEWW
jgi:hypothetical protein